MYQTRKPIIAICYDFDGTLSPRNMQEYDYLSQLRIKPDKFWAEAKERAKTQCADDILAYMCLMLEKASPGSGVRITRRAFATCGKTVQLFPGVKGWFKRIACYAKTAGARLEHYIISSGLKEMIKGTSIGREFKQIFASSFMYDPNGVAHWPAMAINFTTKTQFLFRVNKGLLDPWDNSRINSYIAEDERRIPFSRMIYVGDGSTDIPCMKLIKQQGGFSIAVFRTHSPKKKDAENLLKDNRVNFVAQADYRNGSELDRQVKLVIDKMIAEYRAARGAEKHIFITKRRIVG